MPNDPEESGRREAERAAKVLLDFLDEDGCTVEEVETELGWKRGSLARELRDLTLKYSTVAAVCAARNFGVALFHRALVEAREDELLAKGNHEPPPLK